MKEGLVNLPKDVAIFRQVKDGGDFDLTPLSLAEIPDTEAETLQDAINFVKDQQAIGNNDAVGFHGYPITNRLGKLTDYISYRVVLKQ